MCSITYPIIVFMMLYKCRMHYPILLIKENINKKKGDTKIKLEIFSWSFDQVKYQLP